MVIRILLALAAAGVLLAACGSSASRDAGTGIAGVGGQVTVFAAASLTDAFTEIGASFEAKHPATRVRFNFAGTPVLRTQLEQGARADVFASADAAQMDLALKAGVVESTGAVFARNSLVVIVPASNPGRIESAQDLGRAGVKLVLANPEVPAGAYTGQALTSMGREASFGAGFADRVLRNVVSQESNVKQVVAKVELGEADAGIVYRSDVTASVSGRLKVVEIPPRHNVMAEYPITVVQASRNRAAAAAFVEFLLSPTARRLLEKHGFLPA